jgi:hypothetical protein
MLDVGKGTITETNVVSTYAAGPERHAELLEREGVSPPVEFPGRNGCRLSAGCVSPGGVAERDGGDAIITAKKLAKQTRDVLAMPRGERKRVIEERKAPLARRVKRSDFGYRFGYRHQFGQITLNYDKCLVDKDLRPSWLSLDYAYLS